MDGLFQLHPIRYVVLCYELRDVLVRVSPDPVMSEDRILWCSPVFVPCGYGYGDIPWIGEMRNQMKFKEANQWWGLYGA
jgi:hypothetical protein